MPRSDFRRQKWSLVLRILGIGMGAALVWSAWAAYVLGYGYPESYVLGPRINRFSDFTDETFAATLPNPYVDPLSVYPPVTFVVLRALPHSDTISLICIDFFSLIALAALLYRVLAPVIPDAWFRVSYSFLFLALCYPLLYCIDRGNIDTLAYPLVGWALYFYHQRHDIKGTACLFPIISLKLYPAIFLFLLLRRGKAGLAVSCGLGALAVNAVSLFLYQIPLGVLWNNYQKNNHGMMESAFISNTTVGCAASPWNAYKIVLIALQKLGLIPQINFAFDGPFINASHHAYMIVFGFFTLLCLGYVCFLERNFTRSVIMLLLLITVAHPAGPEYRLTYISMSLVLLVLLRPRPGDLPALVLLALAVIPTKEILLKFASETDAKDSVIYLGSVLNPIFILVAMIILLYHARHPFDWRQAALRLRDLFLPWRWRWV